MCRSCSSLVVVVAGSVPAVGLTTGSVLATVLVLVGGTSFAAGSLGLSTGSVLATVLVLVGGSSIAAGSQEGKR